MVSTISVFALSISVRLVGLLIAMALPIQVDTNAGKSVKGELVSISDKELAIDVDGKTQKLKLEDIQSAKRQEPDDGSSGPKLRVMLRDGSQVAVMDLSMNGEVAKIEPNRQLPINVPAKEIRSVRLKVPSPARDPVWLGIVEENNRNDVLVIRRSSGELDPIPGVIEGIEKTKVAFNIDGETIQAPFTKLEGIVFGGQAAGKPAAGLIQVRDKKGSFFLAKKIALKNAEGPLEVEFSGDLKHSIPLEHLESIFWGGGFQLLSELDPAESAFQPYVKTAVNSELLKDWFGPDADGDDIVISGGGSIEYRLPDEFKTLAGSARRHESVAKAGTVTVRILIDEKEVWSEELKDAKPLGFEIPIKNSRRVRFVADSGTDGELGDMIRVLRPRLLK